MAQKVVATSDSDNLKACFAESRNKLLAGEAWAVYSCGNRDPLNPNEIECFRGRTLNFQTKLDGFADALHEHIERFGLSMTARQGGHGRNKVAFCVLFNSQGNRIKILRLAP